MIKDIILGWLECFGKKYFVVGYVLEAPQNNSEKLFWGVTLVILPRVARIHLHCIPTFLSTTSSLHVDFWEPPDPTLICKHDPMAGASGCVRCQCQGLCLCDDPITGPLVT